MPRRPFQLRARLTKRWDAIPHPLPWALVPWVVGLALGALGFGVTLDLPLPLAAALWAAVLAAGLLLAFRAEPLLWEPQDEATQAQQAPAVEPEPTPPPSAPLDMVEIRGGTFRMGSAPATDADINKIATGSSEDDVRAWLQREQPAHRVRLSPYFMARVPLTRVQWRALMPEAPAAWESDGSDGDLPATHVGWVQAVAFCNALSERERRVPCYLKDAEGQWHWNHEADGYRLPTEAEWEYACQAGTETRWFWGDSVRGAEKHAWYGGNSNNRLHPVKEKAPNNWGLHDMAGLVFEWCWDRYGPYAEEGDQPLVDPAGPSEGNTRVVRGGSFRSPPFILRSAHRGDFRPVDRDGLLGLRCVRSRVRQP